MLSIALPNHQNLIIKTQSSKPIIKTGGHLIQYTP
jgi:hypothetical protein